MSVARIAHRYAKSLIDLSIVQDKLDRILEDVKSFKAVTLNKDFYLFIKSPVIHHARKFQVVKTLFEGKYDELTMAFLRILISKKREMYLPEIANEFLQEYKKFKHITTVKLTTAIPLSEASLEAIHKKLTESTATDSNVELRTNVDANLLGGYILEFDDNVYDASIKHKLEQLKKEFDDNLYISQIIAR